jgi:hypothetical protein
MSHKNSKRNIPAAACQRCGGWTSFGGMSQHSKSATPVHGRTGCNCIKPMKCGGCGTCAKCIASQGRAEERAVD